jgi:hypothetical protein
VIVDLAVSNGEVRQVPLKTRVVTIDLVVHILIVVHDAAAVCLHKARQFGR